MESKPSASGSDIEITDGKGVLRAIRVLPNVPDEDVKKVRSALCGYDPAVHTPGQVMDKLKELPDITADDLARARVALCLWDPER
ncbi:MULTISPECIES: hypothetical protein [unclassified Cupriavidus]|uniref:hypothetical protein n=1 Tax=unclassified Cupriavidus TaxID=2640874 RepID=UPI00313BF196